MECKPEDESSGTYFIPVLQKKSRGGLNLTTPNAFSMPGLCKWEHTASTFLGKLVTAFTGKRPCGNGARHSEVEVGQAVPLATELHISTPRDDV